MSCVSLSSWWLSFNPFEKYANVKLDHFPRVRGENYETYSKPPPIVNYSYRFFQNG